jgi:hypothetical protein
MYVHIIQFNITSGTGTVLLKTNVGNIFNCPNEVSLYDEDLSSERRSLNQET